MSWYIYSSESLPNPDMLGKPGYAPDGEYVRYAGQCLPLLEKGKWMRLPDTFQSLTHRDWTDRRGTEHDIPIHKFKPIVDGRFAQRGVIMIDHEPSAAEKETLEPLSDELNRKWRMECIKNYEDQVREREITGHGRSKPTPYEDECYEILALPKPYGVEAFRAKRMPGNEAAERIADAIAGAMKANNDAMRATADAVIAGMKASQSEAKTPARK